MLWPGKFAHELADFRPVLRVLGKTASAALYARSHAGDRRLWIDVILRIQELQPHWLVNSGPNNALHRHIDMAGKSIEPEMMTQ